MTVIWPTSTHGRSGRPQDFVALASQDDRVDVFQADGNSLDLERSALITGGDDITDILIADFDDNPTRNCGFGQRR